MAPVSLLLNTPSIMYRPQSHPSQSRLHSVPSPHYSFCPPIISNRGWESLNGSNHRWKRRYAIDPQRGWSDGETRNGWNDGEICDEMITDRLDGYTDVYSALEKKLGNLVADNLNKYKLKMRANNEEIKEWMIKYIKK